MAATLDQHEGLIGLSALRGNLLDGRAGAGDGDREQQEVSPGGSQQAPHGL
jgi:hypothetical protein